MLKGGEKKKLKRKANLKQLELLMAQPSCIGLLVEKLTKGGFHRMVEVT